MENNLIGKTYGYLTVIDKTDKNKGRSVVWECRCRCGKTCYVSTRSLNSGETQSCGCKKIELNKKQISVARSNVIITENTNVSRIATNKKPRNNTSGHIGVFKRHRRWCAMIILQKRKIYLGTYDTKEEAIKARINGEEKYYKPIITKWSKTNGNKNN